MDNAWIDGLVKLASIGASGVCVLMVFLVGVMLARREHPDPHWAKLVGRYMSMCIFAAIISAVSGGLNAAFNYATIQRQQSQIATREEQLTVAREQLAQNATALENASKLVDELRVRAVAEELPASIRDALPAFSREIEAAQDFDASSLGVPP